MKPLNKQVKVFIHDRFLIAQCLFRETMSEGTSNIRQTLITNIVEWGLPHPVMQFITRCLQHVVGTTWRFEQVLLVLLKLGVT
jgi:hypothetical protein